MRLSLHTDYALRTLIHLATHDDRLCSIAEIARAYAISENHLMKVVNMLARAGLVRATRGRGGGLALARPATEIRIGEVVRHGEKDMPLVDCASCRIAPACGLSGVMGEAFGAFMGVLDRYTIADVASRRGDLARLLSLEPLVEA